MIGGVVQGTPTKGFWITPQSMSRKLPVVRIRALSTQRIMMIGFSTIAKPKKIGSLMPKTCLDRETRLLLR